jgi:uncharacterized damage-inducible protein DinB
MSEPEYWLRGPVAGVTPLLQPVAHALLQARDDVTRVVSPLTTGQVWMRPGRAASIGFHMKHLCGSLDRLLGYARGESLSGDQLAFLKAEKDPGHPPAHAAALVSLAATAIDRALAQVRATGDDTLLEPRIVGRRALPSTVIGLLVHVAEHTTRHAGQIITTAKMIDDSHQ